MQHLYHPFLHCHGQSRPASTHCPGREQQRRPPPPRAPNYSHPSSHLQRRPHNHPRHHPTSTQLHHNQTRTRMGHTHLPRSCLRRTHRRPPTDATEITAEPRPHPLYQKTRQTRGQTFRPLDHIAKASSPHHPSNRSPLIPSRPRSRPCPLQGQAPLSPHRLQHRIQMAIIHRSRSPPLHRCLSSTHMASRRSQRTPPSRLPRRRQRFSNRDCYHGGV